MRALRPTDAGQLVDIQPSNLSNDTRGPTHSSQSLQTTGSPSHVHGPLRRALSRRDGDDTVHAMTCSQDLESPLSLPPHTRTSLSPDLVHTTGRHTKLARNLSNLNTTSLQSKNHIRGPLRRHIGPHTGRQTTMNALSLVIPIQGLTALTAGTGMDLGGHSLTMPVPVLVRTPLKHRTTRTVNAHFSPIPSPDSPDVS